MDLTFNGVVLAVRRGEIFHLVHFKYVIISARAYVEFYLAISICPAAFMKVLNSNVETLCAVKICCIYYICWIEMFNLVYPIPVSLWRRLWRMSSGFMPER